MELQMFPAFVAAFLRSLFALWDVPIHDPTLFKNVISSPCLNFGLFGISIYKIRMKLNFPNPAIMESGDPVMNILVEIFQTLISEAKILSDINFFQFLTLDY